MAAATIGSLGLILLGGWLGERVAQSLRQGLAFQVFWGIARWSTAMVLMLSSIALLYRLAPNLGKQHARVVPGACVALTGWFAASTMLRWYLGSFSTLGATYGSLAAVIALLFWLYLTGIVLLVGDVTVTSSFQRPCALHLSMATSFAGTEERSKVASGVQCFPGACCEV
jgi:membrane protein